jgi:hypothetical protein
MSKNKYNFTKEEIETKYLQLKTIRACANYYNIPYTSMSFIFKRLGVAHSRHFNQHKFNERFFLQDTPEKFYMAGFIAADGNIDKNLRRITIGLAEKDLPFLAKIKELIEFEGPLTRNISYGSKRNKRYKDTVGYFLRFSSAEVAIELKKFNIVPNKTKIYDMPKWLLTHPLLNHFMRGYFDGDGCLRKYDGQLSFSLVGNLFCLQKYQTILEEECSIHHNQITKDKSVHILKYCGNLIVPKICQFLYNNSTFQLDRKFNVYQRHMKNK